MEVSCNDSKLSTIGLSEKMQGLVSLSYCFGFPRPMSEPVF